MEKILLDTDIGSDIDDAICLAYLLANPHCDLLGITTVSGESIKRAQMASALCRVAGIEVPIYPGRESPLAPGRWWQPFAPQAARLHNWDHASSFAKGQAIDFLRRTIRAHPGEITLLAIGPLTNIAALFTVDPDVGTLLKRLVLMCGVFSNKLPGAGLLEWNAMLDRQATAIVYAQRTTIHRSVGLDVTRQVALAADVVRQRFQAPLLQPVLDFAEVWFAGGQSEVIFHDPLAAAIIFDDAVCQFERGRVQVDVQSSTTPGRTYWSAAADGWHEVAQAVDSGRFFKHFFGVFE